MNTQGDFATWVRSAITALALGVVLMFVAVPSSQADSRAKCHQRIEKAEYKLNEAVRRHGVRSPQAENWRRALINERERCWREHHGWWDAQERRWHTERDWEERHEDRH